MMHVCVCVRMHACMFVCTRPISTYVHTYICTHIRVRNLVVVLDRHVHTYIGDLVVVHGLKKQAEYNGIRCKVTAIQDTQVKVKMLEAPFKSLLLKPSALELA